MADITLTDGSSLSTNASVFDGSVIGKTPSAVIHFLRSDIVGILDKPLDQVQLNSISLGFTFEPSLPLPSGTANLSAGGGLSGEMDLYKPSAAGNLSPLFPKDQFGTDIEMGNQYYLALGFQVTAKVDGTATPGAFTLKLNVGATGAATLYLPFAPTGSNYPTLKSAIESICESFLIPLSTGQIENLKPGSVFTFDYQGTVGFTGSVNLLAAVNPTSSPGVSTSAGPISIQAGPSITIGGGFSLTGEFEVRIWRKAERVFQLGYYKKRNSSLTVSFDMSAGLDVMVGGFDVLSKVYGLLGDSGILDSNWLKAHVPQQVADDVASAYKTAVQTKLSIAIDAECDTSLTDQVAFSWNFDLGTAGSDTETAFEKVLLGDLTSLMTDSVLPAGVTKAGSVFDRLKDNKHTFTFNFLGLFDHTSVQESILENVTKVSEDGQLIMTDTAHVTRLSADATPLVKSDQLRRVFAEDCAATIGYVSSFGSFAPQISVNYGYFDYLSRARSTDLELFVETATALGLNAAASDWAITLELKSSSQTASFFASLGYNGSTASRLFLDGQGNGRTVDDFQSVARRATLATPGLGLDPNFRNCLQNDLRWQQICAAGSASNFYAVIGVDQINPPASSVVAYTWTFHIIFWSSAMQSAGQGLEAVRTYLKENPEVYPLHDKEFLKRRKAFANQLMKAINETPLFHDALGIMTMYLAAPPASRSVAINYAGVSKTYA